MFPITDPILIFLVLALLLLGAPILSEKLRIPDLVILLLAGAAIGPNGFGILDRNDGITMFGAVGILYIMFLPGLEVDTSRFASTLRRSLTLGLMLFTLPLMLGLFAGLYVLHYSFTTSFLLGTLFCTQTLLAYPIVSRFGLARTDPVMVAVGATIITDTLALLALAVVADVVKGQSMGAGFWLEMAAGTTILALAILMLVPLITRWFFLKVSEKGGTQFIFVLLMFCACAYGAHLARLEPIVGAFLAGIAFSRLIPENSALMSRVVFTGNTIFIPFFLISVGMLVDLSTLLRDPRCWFVVLVMLIVEFTGKFIVTALAGRLFGYNPPERKLLFGLCTEKAAAVLAAAQVGYSLQIFDGAVINGVIALILVTVPFGMWMVDRHGRRVAEQITVRSEPTRVEQRILVPVANPDMAARLLDLAFLMRNTSIPGMIHPITIVRDEGDTSEAVAKGEKLLARCLSMAAAVNIPVAPGVRVDINPTDGIIRAAKELRSSLVLAGWSGEQGGLAALFNSVMENLLENCPARLYLCRVQQPLNTAQRLLLVFPPLAERRPDLSLLIREARFFARQTGTELRAYVESMAGPLLRRELTADRNNAAPAIIEAESWGALRARLFDEVRADDILLLPVERRGGVLWTPTMERLPDLIVGRFPNITLLLAYPGLRGEEATQEPLDVPAAEGAVDTAGSSGAAGIRLLPAQLSAVDEVDVAVAELLRKAFPDDTAVVAELQPLLEASARSYPVELTAGVVLLHAHADTLEQPVLLVGCGAGYELPNLPAPARVVLALVSPNSLPPEAHLKSLAGLARRFHDAQVAQTVANAPDANAVAHTIAGADGVLVL